MINMIGTRFQNPTSTDPVGEISAEETAEAAEQKWYEEKHADPAIELRRPGEECSEGRDRRPRDKREYYDLIGIEREAQTGNGDNNPFEHRERAARRGCDIHTGW